MSLRPSQTRPPGFTLLELSVVLGILVLLVALVLPRLGVLRGAELDASARRLAARILYLREDAALRGRAIRLAFDPRRGTYSAEVLVAGDGGAHFAPDPAPLYRTVQLPGEIALEVSGAGLSTTAQGEPATVFSPDGFADPTVIHLDDGAGGVITILIDPAVAQPRVFDRWVDTRQLLAR